MEEVFGHFYMFGKLNHGIICIFRNLCDNFIYLLDEKVVDVIGCCLGSFMEFVLVVDFVNYVVFLAEYTFFTAGP